MAYNNDEDFSKTKLLVDHKKATLNEIALLLIFSKIQDRKFVECTYEEPTTSFRRRWLISMSVLLQKFLLACKTPMAKTGDAVENWLNIIHNNGGFHSLLRCYFKGELEKPEKSSKRFRSFLGYLDMRDELDKSITPGHDKYKACLSLMASKLSYENEAFVNSIVNDHWKMEFLGFKRFWNEDHGDLTTKTILLRDVNSDLIVVAFRGTEPFDAIAWCTDLDLSNYELQGIGNIHHGFMAALGLQRNGWPNNIELDNTHKYAYYKMREILKEKLEENENCRFILTGHSLGGALAILFVAVLFFHEEAWLLERLDGVYTFGQPRVGDKKFGNYMEEKLFKFEVDYFRFVYCNDIIPRVPFDDNTSLYKHFGRCLFSDSRYKLEEMREEPNKNYFSILWALPMTLNACWELIRSFIIPYWKGPEYREGWLLKLFRIVGLMIPGLSAHAPQDYNNCTRLGSLSR